MNIAEKAPDKAAVEPQEADQKPLGFSQLIGGVGNLTRLVESTGSSLFSTGLDTLESIGKKTITVLQQTDPGLKLTKAVLSNPLQVPQDRPCLSQVLILLPLVQLAIIWNLLFKLQVLREAKETNQMEKMMDASDPTSARKPSAKTLVEFFELHHGNFFITCQSKMFAK